MLAVDPKCAAQVGLADDDIGNVTTVGLAVQHLAGAWATCVEEAWESYPEIHGNPADGRNMEFAKLHVRLAELCKDTLTVLEKYPVVNIS